MSNTDKKFKYKGKPSELLESIEFEGCIIKNLKHGVKIAEKLYETEASGNVTLKTVKAIASTGVNRISVGSITHSAPAVDFKLEI